MALIFIRWIKMAKKKKIEEFNEQFLTKEFIEEPIKEETIDFTEIMNPPVEEEEIKKEEKIKEEQPKRKIMQFTPLGPVVKYI